MLVLLIFLLQVTLGWYTWPFWNLSWYFFGQGPLYRSQTCSWWLEKVLHGWPRDYRSQQKKDETANKNPSAVRSLMILMMMMMMMMMVVLVVVMMNLNSQLQGAFCVHEILGITPDLTLTLCEKFGGARESFQKMSSHFRFQISDCLKLGIEHTLHYFTHKLRSHKTYIASLGWDHYRRHLCREAQRTRKIQWEISRTGCSGTVPWPRFNGCVPTQGLRWKSKDRFVFFRYHVLCTVLIYSRFMMVLEDFRKFQKNWSTCAN